MAITIIGIDPGLSGGIAWIQGGQLLSAVRIPTVQAGKKTLLDESEIRALLKDWVGESYVYIEQVSAMPKQGVASMFTFGTGWGFLRGVVVGLGIGYSMVRPQAWQKEILAGVAGKDSKGAAYLYASRRWPSFKWLATDRSKKPHDGMIDAACIAAYGERERHESR